MINAIVIVINILSCFALIAFILLHSGRGGGLSDIGGSSSLSGGTSLERRLDRITVLTAILFGASTFWLSWRWV